MDIVPALHGQPYYRTLNSLPLAVNLINLNSYSNIAYHVMCYQQLYEHEEFR